MAIDEKYGLYIGNLSPKTTHDDLRDKFMRLGSSFSSQIVEDKIAGGFAFVYYQNERALEDALMHTIGTRLHGRVLNIKRAHRNMGRGDSSYGYRGKSYCYICGEGHFAGETWSFRPRMLFIKCYKKLL
ncbi:hypothetical protein MKW92_035559 [Papaver armeniacum]|nr:hypothetical protein MKW92_035559 [Papaver armeniacum]